MATNDDDILTLEIEAPYIGSAVSPEVDITETTDDITVTITDYRGEHSYTVEKTDQAIEDAEQAAQNANDTAQTVAQGWANRQNEINVTMDSMRTLMTNSANAESQRVIAENARVTAENAREQEWNELSTNATAATSAANEAAGQANIAAQGAIGAANAANDATTRANNTITGITQTANQIFAQAVQATIDANAAAQSANTAATNANTKAELADTAAQNADTATTAANNAATTATTAAEAADTAREGIQSTVDEVEDIRTGYDGTVYDSAGDAVRYQVSDINAILDGNYSESTMQSIQLVWNSGKRINGSGYVVDYQSGPTYQTTNPIQVNPGDVYTYTGKINWGNGLYSFYDENDVVVEFLKSENSGTYTTQPNPIKVPQRAKTMILATASSTPDNDSKLKKVLSYKLYGGDFASWKNKTWVCVGDSITENNATASVKYHALIADKTGINVLNYGKSGTGYGKTYGTSNNFADRVLELANVDCDIITIFGSFNDMSIALGTADDTGTETLGGWMNTTFDNLYNTKPFVSVGVILPTPWGSRTPTDPTSDQSKYCDMLAEICRRRSIPVLDLFHNSNLHPDKSNYRDEFYSNADGVHPNNLGHKKIAPMILGFLELLVEFD